MKIVVIGGSGLIGSKVVPALRQAGHEVIAASPSTGVNAITGEGLSRAMANTQVVIDLANSPSFEDRAVLEFFEHRAATCCQRRRKLGFATMSVFPSWARTGRLRMAT